MALLAAAIRQQHPGESAQQRFVVSPQLEGPDTWEGGEQLSVEGGVIYLGFGELHAEEAQQQPVLADLLLEDRSDMGVGGVPDEGEACVRPRVGQRDSCDQGCLGGGGESFRHAGQPG